MTISMRTMDRTERIVDPFDGDGAPPSNGRLTSPKWTEHLTRAFDDPIGAVEVAFERVPTAPNRSPTPSMSQVSESIRTVNPTL